MLTPTVTKFFQYYGKLFNNLGLIDSYKITTNHDLLFRTRTIINFPPFSNSSYFLLIYNQPDDGYALGRKAYKLLFAIIY